MSIKEKSRKELEERVNKLERVIAKKGIGSDYLEKAERVQRDLNLALFVGTTAIVAGLTIWSIYHFSDE